MSLKIQLQQVEAAVQIAEANYKLLRDGASEEDRRTVEAAYEQALASYEAAKESLALVVICLSGPDSPETAADCSRNPVEGSRKAGPAG